MRSLEIDKHAPIKQTVFNIFTRSLYAILGLAKKSMTRHACHNLQYS
jgi:hypothetical protein